jgi:transposase-like protein
MMNGSRQSTDVVAASADMKRDKRHSWSVEEKIRIAEASLKPGACSKTVAQLNGAHPSQLYKWRRLYRSGLLNFDQAPVLLPVRIAETAAERSRPVSREESDAKSGTICLEFASVRVFIEGKADAATLRTVLEKLVG